MKKLLPCLTASFLLSAIVQAHATLIVYGVINGVVTYSSGGFATTVGMPVSGTFSYDYNLLSTPDSSGNRSVSVYDPNAYFEILSSAGEGGGFHGSIYGASNFQLTVGTNGLPNEGSVVGEPDLAIGAAYVNAIYAPGIYWGASVTYTITGVPDASATWLLLGVGLASVVIVRRFFCQIQA